MKFRSSMAVSSVRFRVNAVSAASGVFAKRNSRFHSPARGDSTARRPLPTDAALALHLPDAVGAGVVALGRNDAGVASGWKRCWPLANTLAPKGLDNALNRHAVPNIAEAIHGDFPAHWRAR